MQIDNKWLYHSFLLKTLRNYFRSSQSLYFVCEHSNTIYFVFQLSAMFFFHFVSLLSICFSCSNAARMRDKTDFTFKLNRKCDEMFFCQLRHYTLHPNIDFKERKMNFLYNFLYLLSKNYFYSPVVSEAESIQLHLLLFFSIFKKVLCIHYSILSDFV